MTDNEKAAVRQLRALAWDALLQLRRGDKAQAEISLLQGLLTFEVNGPEELQAGAKK